MAGITELSELPTTLRESEGLTLILRKETAKLAGLAFEQTFRQIILTVYSSLEAVGLTAAVAAKLVSHGISANMVATYYHDHVFMPSENERVPCSHHRKRIFRTILKY